MFPCTPLRRCVCKGEKGLKALLPKQNLEVGQGHIRHMAQQYLAKTTFTARPALVKWPSDFNTMLKLFCWVGRTLHDACGRGLAPFSSMAMTHVSRFVQKCCWSWLACERQATQSPQYKDMSEKEDLPRPHSGQRSWLAQETLSLLGRRSTCSGGCLGSFSNNRLILCLLAKGLTGLRAAQKKDGGEQVSCAQPIKGLAPNMAHVQWAGPSNRLHHGPSTTHAACEAFSSPHKYCWWVHNWLTMLFSKFLLPSDDSTSLSHARSQMHLDYRAGRP